MPSRTRSHRWILALPLVVSVVGFTLREGMIRDDGAVRSIVVDVQADPGAHYSMETDGSVRLDVGGIMAYAPSVGTVHANGWDVSLWGAAAYVSAEQDGSVTVAAFDVPVVARGTLGTAVMPPDTQWTSPASPLPDPQHDPVAWIDAIHVQPLPTHFVREREPTVAVWTAAVPPASLVIPNARTFAATVRLDPSLRVYGSIRPTARDAVWAYVPEAPVIDGDAWMSIMALPAVADADISPLTVRKWGDLLAIALEGHEDMRSQVIERLERDVRRMADDGYPKRALLFAAATVRAAGGYDGLSDTAHAAVDRLAALTPNTLRASVLRDTDLRPAVFVDAPKETSVVITPDPVLEALARTQLIAKGVMFTSDSIVRTAGEGMVDVSGVVVGLPSGDRVLHFRYDPANDDVQAIVDGVVLPNGVAWEVFIGWIGTQNQ